MIATVINTPSPYSFSSLILYLFFLYENNRLGRLKKGGASGPGLFFILPCIDNYRYKQYY